METNEAKDLNKRVTGRVTATGEWLSTPEVTRRMSREAAILYKEALYEAICEVLIEVGPSTADEVADLLDESVLSVRPRVSELYRDIGVIEPTGEKRKNVSGRAAAVWRVKVDE